MELKEMLNSHKEFMSESGTKYTGIFGDANINGKADVQLLTQLFKNRGLGAPAAFDCAKGTASVIDRIGDNNAVNDIIIVLQEYKER